MVEAAWHNITSYYVRSAVPPWQALSPSACDRAQNRREARFGRKSRRGFRRLLSCGFV